MGDQPRQSSREFALRWAAHPATVVSIVVMVLNDHLLKREFGSWWTGKLSDFAGLVFFPAVVAMSVAVLAPRMSRERLTVLAVATTGLGFAIVKATFWGAAAASGSLTALAGPSLVRRDPTDLIALASLCLAGWIAVRASHSEASRRETMRRAVGVVVVPFAVVASVATSEAGTDIATDFVASEGETYLGESNDRWCSPGRDDCAVWYRLDDGWWEQGPGVAPTEDPEGTPQCNPEEPTVCYRPVGSGIGVQVTDDAGATWSTEWSLTTEELEAIAASEFGEVENAKTYDVVVVSAPVGYEVWAANGIDGLAVRHSDGTWERLGWTNTGNPEWAPTALPATEIVRGSELDPGAPWVQPPRMWEWAGALISACAWLILAGGQRGAVARWRTWLGAGLGFAVLVPATVISMSTPRVTDWFIVPFDTAIYALLAACTGILVIGFAAITGSTASAGWPYAAWFFGAALAANSLLGPLVRNEPWPQFAWSAGVALTATVPLWLLARRRALRPPPPLYKPMPPHLAPVGATPAGPVVNLGHPDGPPAPVEPSAGGN